jgi:hypothetical protein
MWGKSGSAAGMPAGIYTEHICTELTSPIGLTSGTRVCAAKLLAETM